MKEHVAKTMMFGNVPSDIGGFGGLFELDIKNIKEPVLVSGTDGVGTKLKMAFPYGQARYRGHRLRGHVRQRHHLRRCQASVLPRLHRGGQELSGKKVAMIVKGVAEGCIQSEAALIGGETAEMPDFYPEDEYDLAGFAVGVVDKSKILKKETICEGDVIIGLPSSGCIPTASPRSESAGRRKGRHQKPLAALGGKSIGETLLTPTKIYVKPMVKLF